MLTVLTVLLLLFVVPLIAPRPLKVSVEHVVCLLVHHRLLLFTTFHPPLPLSHTDTPNP